MFRSIVVGDCFLCDWAGTGLFVVLVGGGVWVLGVGGWGGVCRGVCVCVCVCVCMCVCMCVRSPQEEDTELHLRVQDEKNSVRKKPATHITHKQHTHMHAQFKEKHTQCDCVCVCVCV